jgi:hypothetical protein
MQPSTNSILFKKERFMRRHRRRSVYFRTFCLQDGVVITAYPDRKPLAKSLKQDRQAIDKDNVCHEDFLSTKEFMEIGANRGRFQDVLSNALNTRRNLRELILPELAEIKAELVALRTELASLAARGSD